MTLTFLLRIQKKTFLYLYTDLTPKLLTNQVFKNMRIRENFE